MSVAKLANSLENNVNIFMICVGDVQRYSKAKAASKLCGEAIQKCVHTEY